MHTYSINDAVVSHRIHNIASVSTAKLTAIFACLSHLNGKYLLLTDSLSSLQSLQDFSSSHPLNTYISSFNLSTYSIQKSFSSSSLPSHGQQKPTPLYHPSVMEQSLAKTIPQRTLLHQKNLGTMAVLKQAYFARKLKCQWRRDRGKEWALRNTYERKCGKMKSRRKKEEDER